MGYALPFILDAMVIVEPKLGSSIPRRGMERFAARARGAAGLAGRVDVLITTSARMRRLNWRFLGKDRATDVLSFPAPAAAGKKKDWAGDIAISAEVARANARRLGHSLAGELKVLILHGMLHLAGYDHQTDGGRMRRREQALGRVLGLPAALIERAARLPGPGSGRR